MLVCLKNEAGFSEDEKKKSSNKERKYGRIYPKKLNEEIHRKKSFICFKLILKKKEFRNDKEQQFGNI